jgi:hypothetical protein
MAEVSPTERRVLLGLHDPAHVGLSVETAALFAASLQSKLLCLIVEQEDLVNLAGLPFARMTGFGGFASPLTLESVQEQFDRLVRAAQRSLIKSCTPANIAWHLERPQGQPWRRLLEELQLGDIVVMSLQEFEGAPAGFLNTAQLVLKKASALVLPPVGARGRGPVVAVTMKESGRRAIAMGRDLSQAIGRPFEVIDAQDLTRHRLQASVLVTPLEAVQALGEPAFRRRVKSLIATAVLVDS